MRGLVICGADVPAIRIHDRQRVTVTDLDGVPVPNGVLDDLAMPAFDASAPDNDRRVLVRVRAFSCNYRDKAIILRLATTIRANGYAPVGSEFCGEVESVGPGVTTVRVGDRVVADNSYGGPPSDAWRGGIPSNQSSREYLVLGEHQIARVPDGVSDAHAAALSLGGQTAFAILDRLDIRDDSHVLVTAARSNTSLFAIAALRRRTPHVYAITTSAQSVVTLRTLGAAEVFVVPGTTPLVDHPELMARAQSVGGFDRVVDPFFDLYLPRVVPLMAPGGRYATCGFYDQYLNVTGGEFPGARPDFDTVLRLAVMRNLTLMGNCLGRAHHLRDALDEHAAGRLPIVLDSVLRGDDATRILERTYSAPDRFGKVVYAYD